MRALAVVVLLALCATHIAPARSEAGSTRKPRLEILGLAPFLVRGTGFRSGERVRILATAAGLETKRVTATTVGSFTVRLRLRPGRCTGVVVQAFGAVGSRATIDRPALDCMEP